MYFFKRSLLVFLVLGIFSSVTGADIAFMEKYNGKCSGKIKGDIEYLKDKDCESLYLKKGASIQYPPGKIPVPCTISYNIKSAKSFNYNNRICRRYWSTAFRGNGYIFMQQMGHFILFGFHQFNNSKGKKVPKNMQVNFKPTIGVWYNFTVNISDKQAEFYINGIKRGSITFDFKIDPAKLGAMIIGGGHINDFSISGISIYNRILSGEEIKLLVENDKFVSKVKKDQSTSKK